MNKIELNEVIATANKLKKLERKIAGKLSNAPTGNLKCLNKGNYQQYYVNGKYVKKSNMEYVKKLAERDYYKKLLPALREKIDVLDKISELMNYDFDKPGAIYNNLCPGRKQIVTPALITNETFLENWQNEPYDHWKITDEDVRGNFITLNGERVRSKSEKMIADELTKYGIPYRYEYPLKILNNSRLITLRPDFIVISPVTLKEFIIEHLGLLDHESYYNRNLDKLGIYEQNGYLLGKNLLIFHETSNRPIDISLVDRYIEEYLL